ncbi:hypothetical protein [Magnetococcus sp. PR-3]|uniref:hypothetical protein n=1 Tax=Magnetococcus sp. PR-3 TaxID=3120355 RepID=UPI002FCE3B46
MPSLAELDTQEKIEECAQRVVGTAMEMLGEPVSTNHGVTDFKKYALQVKNRKKIKPSFNWCKAYDDKYSRAGS